MVSGVGDLSGRVQSGEAELQVRTGKRHGCWRWVPGNNRRSSIYFSLLLNEVVIMSTSRDARVEEMSSYL